MKIDGKRADEFEADSARALCAYLFLRAGETIRRENLAALLWPDQPQTSALRNLRTALSRMRHGLGPLNDALYSDNQVVALHPSDGWVDARELARLVEEVESHLHRRLVGCPICIEKLQRAVSLYAGEFLEGFSLASDLFSDWAAIQREYLHRCAIDAFDTLAVYHLERREWLEAQRMAQQALKFEPWREESHRHVMQAFVGRGQRSAALNQFRICQQTLQRELDAPPQPETIALYEQIRSNAYSLEEEPKFQPGRLLPTGSHPVDDLPLIGRDHELAALIELLVTPSTRLATLVGEGGVGKTRLALRAARRVALTFIDGVFLVALHPEEQTGETFLRSMPAVARVAQQIALACAIPISDRDSAEHAVLAFLRHRSILLLLDSFEQHEDALPFLLSLLEGAPDCVFLLTTHRPLNVRQERVLRLDGLDIPTHVAGQQTTASSLVLFETLARQRGVADALEPSHLPAIIQICQTMGGLPLGIELAVACLPHIDRLHEASWSAEQMAQLLQRATDPAEQVLLDLPPRHRGLRAAFEIAWCLLNRETQETLATLSLFHSSFSAGLVASVLGMEETEEVRERLWRLVERSLVQSNDAVTFSLHDRIRYLAAEKFARSSFRPLAIERYTTTFLTRLVGGERALNGKESYAVQQRFAAEMADIVAAWRWAVQGNRWNLLAEAAFGFARFHLLRGLYREGELMLAETVQVLRRVHLSVVSLSAGHAASVAVESTSRMHVGEPLAHRATFADMQRRWNGNAATAFAHALACLLVAWARLIKRIDRQDVAEPLLREALRLSDDPGLQTDALVDLGWCVFDLGRTAEAESLLRQALALAERLNDPDRRVDALNGLAAVYRRRGEKAASLRCLEEALDLAREQENLTMVAIILGNQSIHYLDCGEHARAFAVLNEALKIHHTQRNVRMEASNLYSLGICYDARGQYVEAQEHYRKALAIAEEIDDRPSLMETWINIGISLDQIGDYEGALDATLRAFAVEQGVNNPQGRCTLFANLSLHYHHLGDQQQALHYAQDAIALATQIEMPMMAAYGYDFLGHALLALQQLDEAENAYHQALALRASLQLDLLSFESRAGLARVALARGDIQSSMEWVEPIYAHLLHHALEGVEEPLRIYWTVYQVLRLQGDPGAQAILVRACQVLERTTERISDRTLRQHCLTQVDAHRSLLQDAADCDATKEYARRIQSLH